MKVEQDGYDIEYTDDLREYKEWKRAFEHNKYKASALILGLCNNIMQAWIKAIPDYESRVMDDLVVLLKEISLKMYDPSDEKYEFETVYKTFKQLFGTTQEDGESLLDYTKWLSNQEIISRTL